MALTFLYFIHQASTISSRWKSENEHFHKNIILFFCHRELLYVYLCMRKNRIKRNIIRFYWKYTIRPLFLLFLTPYVCENFYAAIHDNSNIIYDDTTLWLDFAFVQLLNHKNIIIMAHNLNGWCWWLKLHIWGSWSR